MLHHPQKSFLGHTDAIKKVVISRSGQFAVTSCADQFIRFWDLSNESPLPSQVLPLEYPKESGGIIGLDLSANDRYLVWAHQRDVILYNIENPHFGQSYPCDARVSAVAFTPDNLFIITNGKFDKGINRIYMYMWHMPGSNKYRSSAWGHQQIINRIAISPDGKYAVTCSDYSRYMELWKLNAKKGKLQADKKTQEYKNQFYDIAISPDSRNILTANVDGTLYLCNIRDGKISKTLEGHTGSATSVTFLGKPQKAASGDTDGSIRIWDINSGSCIHAFNAHEGRITSIAATSDGSHLLTGDKTGNLYLWSLESLP